LLKDTEFAYAVARIRSNESKLLTSPQIESLITASNYEEALRLLSDAGYDGIDSSNEDAVLSKRLSDAFELIYESAPDKNCLDFLIVRNDFHNLKACIKSMIAGVSCDGLLLSPCIVDGSTLKNAVEQKDFESLPEFLSNTARKAYSLVAETMDGQSLEVFLDRKCLEASIKLAKATEDTFSISLSMLFAALSNIKIALRCCKTGKDKAFMENAFAECSLIDLNQLAQSVLDGEDSLAEYVKRAGFEKLADSIKKGYASFEKISDDMLIEKIQDAKYKALGISPLVAYYFATDAEIKTVRIILSCKKNGMSDEVIRERVRVLYV